MCESCVFCIQIEKQTEENYKKKPTAVFRSATERLLSSLLTKVSLFSSPPSQHVAVVKLLKRTYQKSLRWGKTALHAKLLTFINGPSQRLHLTHYAMGPVFQQLIFFGCFFSLLPLPPNAHLC